MYMYILCMYIHVHVCRYILIVQLATVTVHADKMAPSYACTYMYLYIIYMYMLAWQRDHVRSSHYKQMHTCKM